MRILIVEDEQDLRQVMVKRLIADNYSVDAVDNGADALHYMSLADYDCVLLDIMIPNVNGLEVLRTIRSEDKAIPVLLLTARDAVEDRVMGLDSGADDYLVKPFAFDELLARIRVLTRRQFGSVSNIFHIEDLTVDCNARTVIRGNKDIELSSKEFAILEYLIRNKGIVLSREKIEQHVWNYDYEGGSNIIDVYIRYLRKKIDSGHEVKLIQTVRGSGYVLRGKS